MGKKSVGLVLVMVAAMLCGACRDEPAPERYNVNLGTADRPLLPTSMRQLDKSILSGRADFVPLPEVGAFGEVEPADDPSGADDDEAAIAAVFDALNVAVANWDVEAIVPLVVESQREVIRESLPGIKLFAEAAEAFQAAVVESNPALAGNASVPFGSPLVLAFDETTEITFLSDTEASVSAGLMGDVRLVKVDEGWVVELPGLDGDVGVSRMAAMADALDDLTSSVRDGSVTPAEIAQRMAEIMQLGVADDQE